MEAKHVTAVVIGGAVLAALTHFLIKRYMPATTAQTLAPATTTVQASTPVAAYTPVSNAYAPLPIGAIQAGTDNHTSQLPPGLSESSVMLPSVSPPKSLPDSGSSWKDALASVVPDTPHRDTTDPTTNGVNGLTGNAALIDSAYFKLFGRHAEQAGLDFWGNTMDRGIVTASTLEQNLTRGAQNADRGAEVTLHPELVIQYLNGNG